MLFASACIAVDDTYHRSFVYHSVAATEAETNFESTRPLTLREVRYEEACNRIAVEAVKRGCTDNVSVMIIDIQKPLNTTSSIN